MNITLSADPETIKRTRAYARRHDTSLNQLVRDYLDRLTAQEARHQVADEFVANALTHAGRSPAGFRFRREAAQRTRD